MSPEPSDLYWSRGVHVPGYHWAVYLGDGGDASFPDGIGFRVVCVSP